MQHPTTISETTEVQTGHQTATSTGHLVTLATERALKAPLGALRVLLEGARQGRGSTPDMPFIDRALDSLRRAENAAQDLVAWAAPRTLRSTPATIGEMIESLSAALEPEMLRRCHLVIDDENTRLQTDARLLVDTFVRTVRDRLAGCAFNARNEIMIHAHADAAWATFSFIDTPDAAQVPLETASTPSLIDMILERDITRVGGRVSSHETGGHRCCVVVIPLTASEEAA